MITENVQETELLEKAIRDLQESEYLRQGGGVEVRKASYVKLYRQLKTEQRCGLCMRAVELLRERFVAGTSPDDILSILVTGFASERDWEPARAFLETMLQKVTNSESLKEVAICLLEVADNELTEERGKLPVGQTALVLLTELGLLMAGRAGGSALDYRGMDRVVEYITTSLLARSNVNDNAMRIALIHYLSKQPSKGTTTTQLNRVISRFGQSLLEDLMKAYFEDRKRGNAAFHFLVQHLNVFFVASPALAEMSHDVLKHYMLKFPEEFPAFLGSYCERLPHDTLRLTVTTRTVALLLRAAVDVSKKALAEAISDILVRHLAVFRDASVEMMAEQISIARQLANPPGGRQTSATSAVELFLAATQELIDEGAERKVIPIGGKMAKLRKSKPVLKSSRIGEEPTPLETMLSLAS